MSSIIQFTIRKDEDGYSAKAVNFPIFTCGKTLSEVEHNIQEVTDLFLEDEDLASLGLSDKPSVMVNFEIPLQVYA
ncbi:hypothetical protein A3H53_01010 [Candidatus Nomurabacteria bacterium RIFCSPLOWO2_02_FULL_40_10]|uniref:HicB-like antitoxin of toxin-antitoxin system domain-containing protein n=2 Tax=Candidatus Nomuraibacteriota TaxID=1752729 RepID=A0A1F6Y0B2_9BACT|nr:MAG: hypothetical protein A2642_04365 [Candidatus Nomurabacteria bacterium RIFCSPHIGHO2_01_FULL_39_10]OGI99783.1 MAG: hypothetical protein A3H53_01010 [Candidatus Nomurabacteria bacterium RIFCSPLOWO2_02_FULL_40_10]